MTIKSALCASAAFAFLGAALLRGCERSAPPSRADFEVGGATGFVRVPLERAGTLGDVVETARSQFEASWRLFDPSDRRSEINKINRMAGASPLPVAFPMFRALDLAHFYSRLTDGAYDIASSAALELWGIGGVAPDMEPSNDEIAAVLEISGYRHVQFSERGTIAILTPGARLAPGPLAFAYGVDLAVLELRRLGVGSAVVGWNRFVRARGEERPQRPWRLPVRHPFVEGTPLGEVTIPADHALAVIGLRDYTIEVGGRRFSAVIDPRKGRPAEGTALVAVIAPTCVMANALAHALLVAGRDGARKFLERFPDCEVGLVPDRAPLELWATHGWMALFSPAGGIPPPKPLSRSGEKPL